MKRSVALIFLAAIVFLAMRVEWWMAIAMLAVVLYASLVFLDAFMFKGNVYQSFTQPLVVTALMQLAPWIMFPFVVTDFSSFTAFGLAFGSGVVNMVGYFLYFKAMNDDQDAVVISTMWNLMIAFVPILAYFTIGEVIEVTQYVGIGIIFTGALIASFKKAMVNLKVVLLMLGAVGLLSLSMVGMKEAYNILAEEGGVTPFWSGLLPRALGCGLVGMLFLTHTLARTESRMHFTALVKTFWPVFLLTEAFQVGADALTSLSTTEGEVSVITAMDGLMGIFAAGLSVLLVYVFSMLRTRDELQKTATQLCNEQFEHFSLKVVGMSLIIVGAYLVA